MAKKGRFSLVTEDLARVKRKLSESYTITPNRHLGQHGAPIPAYIAKTGSTGIIARSTAATPIAGSASCDVFKASSSGALTDATFDETVYNLSTADIPGSRYITIQRDGFGTWWATQIGSHVPDYALPDPAGSTSEVALVFSTGSTWTWDNISTCT